MTGLGEMVGWAWAWVAVGLVLTADVLTAVVLLRALG